MHPDTIDPKAYARRWKTLAVLSLSLLIIGLDNTVLNVALPTLQTHFSASGSTLQWIVDSYLLSFAGVLLTMGTLGDRFGRKRALQAGLVLFGVASVLAAFAQDADSADRAARRDGHRRRDDHAGDAVGDHGRLPARGARQGDRDLVGDRGRRHRPRPVRRRPAARVVLVELGVLAQRADRRPSRWSPDSPSSPRAATRSPARSTSAARRCRSRRSSRSSTGSSRPARAAGPTRSCSAASRPRRSSASRSSCGSAASPRRCCRSAFFRDPRFTRRVRRRRARLLRDDGLGLRVHAVPPVRARLQRAGGGRRDAAARARARHRLRRVQPARRSASAAPA